MAAYWNAQMYPSPLRLRLERLGNWVLLIIVSPILLIILIIMGIEFVSALRKYGWQGTMNKLKQLPPLC